MDEDKRGFGRYICYNKHSISEGYFEDYKLNGECHIFYKNGNHYVGGIKDGQKSGYGNMYYPDGKVYMGGEWISNYISKRPRERTPVNKVNC